MTELLIHVYLNGDKKKPARGQPLRAGISGGAALDELEKLNGAGGLRSPSIVFISRDDKNLAAGDYHFIPAESPGASGVCASSSCCLSSSLARSS